jgi:predicted esterase
MVNNVGSPSPKRTPNDAAKAGKDSARAGKDSAKPGKDSAVKDTGRKANLTETVRKMPRIDKEPEQTKKPKTTRRRKRKEGDWNYKEEEHTYVLEPQKPDVHKYTWIYLHYLCGHPKEYFTVEGFQTPGLKVVLPKAPVLRSLHYGEGSKTSKSRLWYDYYHDPDDPNEDPSQGADAEELELDSDEEKEVQKKQKKMGIEAEEEEEEAEEETQNEEPGDAEPAEKEVKKSAADKFSEFLATLKPDTHPEINIPKEKQVEKSIKRVLAIVHQEAKALGGDYSRVFLGGWSQGAAVALCVAIHKECPSLGGLLATTGTFHTQRVEDALKHPVKTTPFVLYVGVKDDTYPVMLLMPMIEKLRSQGFKIELREKNMDHNLNGNIGPAHKVEERWMNQYIETLYQDSSIGALMKASCAAPPVDGKDLEAAVKVLYHTLFGNKVPHNRRAEIMKYSCWEGKYEDIQKNVNKISEEDLKLVARFFGAEGGCTKEALTRLLVTPNATAMAALRAGPAPMETD